MTEEQQEVEKEPEADVAVEEQETQEQPKEEPEKEKPKKSAEDRIKEIKHQTYLKHEAQRQLDAREAELADRERKIQEQEERTLVKPNPDNYDDHDKYLSDSENFHAQKAALDSRRMARDQIMQERQQMQMAQTQREWELKKQQAMEKDPSFIVNENKVDMTLRTYRAHPIVAQAIVESDNSHELITYLGNNAEDIQRIAQIPPQSALRELGKLEGKLTAQIEKKITNAPPPVDDLEGGRSASLDPSLQKQADYNATKNKEQYGY